MLIEKNKIAAIKFIDGSEIIATLSENQQSDETVIQNPIQLYVDSSGTIKVNVFMIAANKNEDIKIKNSSILSTYVPRQDIVDEYLKIIGEENGPK